MKALRLFKALSMVDEKWVEEAWDYQPPARKRRPALYGLAAAACCTLFCAFGFFYLVTGGFPWLRQRRAGGIPRRINGRGRGGQ